jgi:ribosomal protein S18 acetylase RimI-like enzyme
VRSDRELVAAANENFLASFRKMAEHGPRGDVREDLGVFAFATGLPLSLFNGCVATQSVARSTFADCLDWVRAHDVPFRAWVTEDLVSELGDVPPAFGLDPTWTAYPGMVLHPISEPPTATADVTVEPVDAAGREAFLDVNIRLGVPVELAERLFPASFGLDPEVRCFVGRLAGEVVGTAIAIRSRQASGVYNVATLPEARRRGVGAALTWAALEAGVSWGQDTIVLQSTEMGYSLYRGMGFRTVVPYAMFGPLH